MITTNSENECFMCAQNVCTEQTLSREEGEAVAQNVHQLKKYLRQLWMNIWLFFETDKWELTVSLKVGDSHIVMRMEDIESRWRG